MRAFNLKAAEGYSKVLQAGAPCNIGYNVTVQHRKGEEFTMYTRNGRYKLTGLIEALWSLFNAECIDALSRGKKVYRVTPDVKLEVTEVMELIKIRGVYRLD